MRGGDLRVSQERPSSLASRTQARPNEKFCVLADLLLPGRGDPIRDGCIIVEGKKITYAGKAADAFSQRKDLPETHVPVLMPGMWDCHVHFMGLQKLDVAEMLGGAENQALTGARCARDAMLLLNSGFTSVRDLAGYGIEIDRAIEEGTTVGPKIYSAKCIIVCHSRITHALKSITYVLLESNWRSCRHP